MTNKKYSIDMIKENINKFIYNNSNQDGIDISNVYVGRLLYFEDEDENIEDKLLSNKVTLVYIIENSDDSVIYVDLFKERIYETQTCYVPGMLSFAPTIKANGLSILNTFKLSNLLNLKRMTIDELKKFYNEIENINYNDFFMMSDQELKSLYDAHYHSL